MSQRGATTASLSVVGAATTSFAAARGIGDTFDETTPEAALGKGLLCAKLTA
jgi:hypothetical protein